VPNIVVNILHACLRKVFEVHRPGDVNDSSENVIRYLGGKVAHLAGNFLDHGGIAGRGAAGAGVTNGTVMEEQDPQRVFRRFKL
jgi:hypothetical protein